MISSDQGNARALGVQRPGLELGRYSLIGLHPVRPIATPGGCIVSVTDERDWIVTTWSFNGVVYTLTDNIVNGGYSVFGFADTAVEAIMSGSVDCSGGPDGPLSYVLFSDFSFDSTVQTGVSELRVRYSIAPCFSPCFTTVDFFVTCAP